MGYAKESDGAHEPFLDDNRTNDNTVKVTSQFQIPSDVSTKGCRRSSSISARNAVFHVALVAMYTLLSALTIYALRYDAKDSTSKYASPAWLSELKLNPGPTIFNSDRSPYIGPASNTTVQNAWSSLLNPINMRVTDDELALSGVRQSVKLPSTKKSGAYNLAWLDVFYELRCLDLLRQSAHGGLGVLETSNDAPDTSETEIDQCVEVLRQNIMCHPDLTLSGLKWDSSSSRPVIDTRSRVKECVEWDIMIDSLGQREVSVEEMESLRNPLS